MWPSQIITKLHNCLALISVYSDGQAADKNLSGLAAEVPGKCINVTQKWCKIIYSHYAFSQGQDSYNQYINAPKIWNMHHLHILLLNKQESWMGILYSKSCFKH